MENDSVAIKRMIRNLEAGSSFAPFKYSKMLHHGSDGDDDDEDYNDDKTVPFLFIWSLRMKFTELDFGRLLWLCC